MVRKKIIILSLFFLFLAIPLASAITVKATVKVEPFHSSFVQVANPNTRMVIAQNYNSTTDVTGESHFDFNTGLKEVSFFIKSVNPVTFSKTEEWFEDLPITMNMLVDSTEGAYDEELEKINDNGDEESDLEITEESLIDDSLDNSVDIEVQVEEESEQELEQADEINAEEEVKVVVPEELSGITGFFISEGGDINPVIYYIIGLVAIMGIIMLVLVKARHNLNFPSFKKPANNSSIDSKLKDAQRKLKEAQREIKEIKKSEIMAKTVHDERKEAREKAEKEYEEARIKLEKIGGLKTDNNPNNTINKNS